MHPAPGSVPPGDEHYYRRVRFHRLGDDPARDALVFGEGQAKERILSVDTSPNGRFVLLAAFDGWVRGDVYLLDRERPEAGLRVVIEGADGLTHGEPADDRIWLRTNVGSPNYRIVSADPDEPSQWTTVVPEGEHAIEAFRLTRDHLAVHTLGRATSRLAIWSKAGRKEREVALPGVGRSPGPARTSASRRTRAGRPSPIRTSRSPIRRPRTASTRAPASSARSSGSRARRGSPRSGWSRRRTRRRTGPR